MSTTIKLYLKYKLFQMKEFVFDSYKTVKLKYLADIIAVALFGYLVIAYIRKDYFSLALSIFVYAFLLIFLMYKDYVSGDHVRWSREQQNSEE